ncbi:hypothetical protein [Bordetella hinzii]|uniref:hypothetical protein n=1 Tax=Bordetella hinzii TaxID=103855 RepID=UPI0039FDDB46
MTTKHTPGPWKVFDSMVYGDTYGIDGEDGTAVVYYGYRDTKNGIPKKADARLIAAAPELLEALEKRAQADAAYAQLAMSDVTPDTHEQLLQQIEDAEEAAKDAARAAIAKAKGEQQ